MSRPLSLATVASIFAAGLLAACENGTTSAALPLYEAGTSDVTSVFARDSGRDSGAHDALADGLKHDAPVADALHPTDTGIEADAGHDGTLPSDAMSDAHVDAGADAVTAADAHDAGVTDAATDAG